MRRRTLLPLSVRLNLESFEDRSNPSSPGTAYLATDLVSDQPGVAPITDPTLVNAWGISLSATGGAFWVSSNGQNLSELYGGDTNGSAITQPFKVAIPFGAPTGQVFNNTGSATDFSVTDGTNTKPSAFIFASESGWITGWNPGVGATAPGPSLTAEVGFQAMDGAVYKGLALAQVGTANFLYAADFHNNKIDVIDGNFKQVTLGTGGFENFTDPHLPNGFAPFNIANIGGKLYVSYAKQDAAKHDDVAGQGNGFIDVFETNGHFDGRLVSGGALNSPWGMVQAPANFGQFSNDLLVGNFGDGRIHAYNPTTGAFLSTLSESNGHPLVLDGLWGLAFGNGNGGGDKTSLYFASGPDDEAHGIFGKITANPAGTNPVSAKLTGTDLAITGSPDNDHVTVSLNHSGNVIVTSGFQQIGQFPASSVATIHFNGFAGNDVFSVDHRITATVIADGGAGNDLLFGGGGPNILLGNAGNDIVFGGSGRNILVGGDGMDVLLGGNNEDILIGGNTTFDTTSLQQILNTWTGAGDFATRVAAIKAGTGGVPMLVNGTTVLDDGVADVLVGGPGLDWYFGTSPDRFIGRTPGEQTN